MECEAVVHLLWGNRETPVSSVLSPGIFKYIQSTIRWIWNSKISWRHAH